MDKTRFAVVLSVLSVFCGPDIARAQSDPRPIGVEIFAGGNWRPEPEEGEPLPEHPPMGGWQMGASVRAGEGLLWLGWTGSYGSHSSETVSVREALGGVRVFSPFLKEAGGRAFAHVLGGRAWSRLTSGVEDAGPALVVGGGVDMLIFVRLQADWVRTEVLPQKNLARAFIGGVLPLCFGCDNHWLVGIPLKK